jgi:hypothetical protein
MATGDSLICLGIVDSIAFLMLLIPLALESRYIALNATSCNNVRLNNTSDPHLVLFERLWHTNTTNPNLGYDLCDKWLTTWYLGLTVLQVENAPVFLTASNFVVVLFTFLWLYQISHSVLKGKKVNTVSSNAASWLKIHLFNMSL